MVFNIILYTNYTYILKKGKEKTWSKLKQIFFKGNFLRSPRFSSARKMLLSLSPRWWDLKMKMKPTRAKSQREEPCSLCPTSGAEDLLVRSVWPTRPGHGQSFWIVSKTTPLILSGSLESLLSYLDIPLLSNKSKTSLFNISSYSRFFYMRPHPLADNTSILPLGWWPVPYLRGIMSILHSVIVTAFSLFELLLLR